MAAASSAALAGFTAEDFLGVSAVFIFSIRLDIYFTRFRSFASKSSLARLYLILLQIGLCYHAWFDDQAFAFFLDPTLAGPRAIYRRVANLLDYSISVCDNQHIEHYELVTFAIEAVANAASH